MPPPCRPADLGVLRDRYVPEDRCGELENTLDVLSEGRRLEPFAPRHVRNLFEGDLLDLVGELLALRLIGRTHPVGGELLELRDDGPTEPSACAGARHAEVNGGVDHVRGRPPRVKDVPPTLVRRLLAGAEREVR